MRHAAYSRCWSRLRSLGIAAACLSRRNPSLYSPTSGKTRMATATSWERFSLREHNASSACAGGTVGTCAPRVTLRNLTTIPFWFGPSYLVPKTFIVASPGTPIFKSSRPNSNVARAGTEDVYWPVGPVKNVSGYLMAPTDHGSIQTDFCRPAQFTWSSALRTIHVGRRHVNVRGRRLGSTRGAGQF